MLIRHFMMGNIGDDIIYPPNNEIWYTSSDGNSIDVDIADINNDLLSNTYMSKGVLVFQNNVDNIHYLFSNKTKLIKVWLPNYSITGAIEPFSNCSNLIEINNSEQLKCIGDWAFRNCLNLPQIKIDSDLIGEQAFYNCMFLKYVKISKRIESISSAAFTYCFTLESINYEGTIEEWNNIDIASDWCNNSAIKTIHCSDGDIEL